MLSYANCFLVSSWAHRRRSAIIQLLAKRKQRAKKKYWLNCLLLKKRGWMETELWSSAAKQSASRQEEWAAAAAGGRAGRQMRVRRSIDWREERKWQTEPRKKKGENGGWKDDEKETRYELELETRAHESRSWGAGGVVRRSDADRQKRRKVAENISKMKVSVCCRQLLAAGFCSVTTGLLWTTFTVRLYLISLYHRHAPPPAPVCHPDTLPLWFFHRRWNKMAPFFPPSST